MKTYKIYIQGYLVQPIVTTNKARMESIKRDAIGAKRNIIISELRRA